MGNGGPGSGAMDFFQRQEDARRNTKRLVLIFVLGVLAIIVAVHGVVSFIAWESFGKATPAAAMGERTYVDAFLLNPEFFGVVAVAVAAVVAAGSLYRIGTLGGGGEKIARTLGGTRLDVSTTDPEERQLLNVVQEMAIASGVPVPPIFVLEEEAINAFAAGFEPTDAVIGVTRGAVEHLDRDELQGVIAHEFSHILNGDMRLNLRLIGILHGILLIGLIGRLLIGSRHHRRRRGDRGAQAALLGIALLAIGYLGTLCGNLIKAAVSREREFLADASAVQFTRNPGGIAGALKKIGGLARGSRISHPRAEEASHMYFGAGVRNRLGSLFATHPPLAERIRRIEPSFDGDFPPVEEGAAGAGLPRAGGGATSALAGPAPEGGVPGEAGTRPAGPGETGAPPGAEGAGAAAAGEARTGSPGTVSLEEALRQIGSPTRQHLEYVRELLASVPPALREAAGETEGARALLHVLLLDADPAVRSAQESTLEERAEPGVRERIPGLARRIPDLDPHARLPLLELLLATLKGMEEDEYRRLRETVEALVEADDRVGLFEWVAGSLVLRELDPRAAERKREGRYTKLQGVSDALVHLLSALAHAGHEEAADAAAAFREGTTGLAGVEGREILGPGALDPAALDYALDRLAHLVPRLKKEVLEACARTIAADRIVTTAEGELFRVVADWLDCPVPPLLPGQRVA